MSDVMAEKEKETLFKLCNILHALAYSKQICNVQKYAKPNFSQLNLNRHNPKLQVLAYKKIELTEIRFCIFTPSCKKSIKLK